MAPTKPQVWRLSVTFLWDVLSDLLAPFSKMSGAVYVHKFSTEQKQHGELLCWLKSCIQQGSGNKY